MMLVFGDWSPKVLCKTSVGLGYIYIYINVKAPSDNADKSVKSVIWYNTDL